VQCLPQPQPSLFMRLFPPLSDSIIGNSSSNCLKCLVCGFVNVSSTSIIELWTMLQWWLKNKCVASQSRLSYLHHPRLPPWSKSGSQSSSRWNHCYHATCLSYGATSLSCGAVPTSSRVPVGFNAITQTVPRVELYLPDAELQVELHLHDAELQVEIHLPATELQVELHLYDAEF